MDAVQSAATSSELVMAWREVGKLLGSYEPERKILEIHDYTQDELRELSDKDLARLAGSDMQKVIEDADYHEVLAARLKTISDAAWVLTYDDCPEVRRMYRGWAAIRPFSLRYSATERRTGRELLITPKWMRLPEEQRSAAVTW